VSPDDRKVAGSRRYAVAFAGCVLLTVLLALAGLLLGPADAGIGSSDVAKVIAYHCGLGGGTPPEETANAIVWEVRLPRVMAAALVGALLALAGVALQGLLMNPLADPYTIGASAGAAVGAAAAEVLGIAALAGGLCGVGAAFAAAVGSAVLVYTLARVGGRVSVHTVLLAGVVVGTLLWSLIPLLMVLAGRGDDLQRIYFYLIGSLQGADWTRVWLVTPFALVTALALGRWHRELNIITFGEETAHHLGVPVESFKRRVLAVGALATAAAVSVAGIIGFVGLIVPHMARRVVGPDHLRLLPVAALLGACLLMVSDMIVRVWLNEMPVGVITAIVGAPLFCMLLRRRRAAAW
jgi:iron complex transport system permease protein